MILSYILHGHTPYYNGPHKDSLIDRRLITSSNLLHINPDTYSHLRSSLNYSSQALPINVLLDTLLRPNGDTDLDVHSCVEWRYEPEKAIPHVVVGDAPAPGGQWAHNPVTASWDIESLSYAEQLSLPGYTFHDHWRATKGEELPELIRPTRKDVAHYLSRYPSAVGIVDSIQTGNHIKSIRRWTHGQEGFHITCSDDDITCRYIVLATGIFNVPLPPPPLLDGLKSLSPHPGSPEANGPLLIIGSGFTAADLIISTPPNRKIIHIYNWDPVSRPSPLKGCHASAYPEYAWVYRLMRSAIERHRGSLSKQEAVAQLKQPPKSEIKAFEQRNWSATYEGFPNARIMETSLDGDFEGVLSGVPSKDRFKESIRRQSEDLTRPMHLQHKEPETKKYSHFGIFNMFGRRGSVPATSMSLAPDTETEEQQRSASVSYLPLTRTKSGRHFSATVLIGRSYIGAESFEDTLPRTITEFQYAAGRRGSLAYLHPSLLKEVLELDGQTSSSTLSNRDRAPNLHLNLAPTEQSPSTHLAVPAPNTQAQSPLSPPRSHASLHKPSPSNTSDTSHSRSSSSSSTKSTTLETGNTTLVLPTIPSQASHTAARATAMAEEAQAPLPVPKTIVQHDFATDMLARPEELLVTGATLRAKIEGAGNDRGHGFELAKDVYVVGSLTGDSLIRFAFGGCCVVGGALQQSVLGRGNSETERGTHDGNHGIDDIRYEQERSTGSDDGGKRISVTGTGGDGVERSMDLTEEWQS